MMIPKFMITLLSSALVGRAVAVDRVAPDTHLRRHVYIDLGVNWCNTIRLFEDIAPPNAMGGWDVFGFEAHPLLQPYAEAMLAHLDGKQPMPMSCLPLSGSTRHLALYAGLYGCPTKMSTRAQRNAVRACSFQHLNSSLQQLRPDPALNSTDLIATRLGRAAKGFRHAHAHASSRFTFVPAAAGGVESAQHGWLDLTMYSRLGLISGGGQVELIGANGSMVRPTGLERFRVPVVDISAWMRRSFSKHDHVILKMDIEGAEHELMADLLRDGGLQLVDQLVLECHEPVEYMHHLAKVAPFGTCAALLQHVRTSAPDLQIMTEGKHFLGAHFGGMDARTERELPRHIELLRKWRANGTCA